MKKLIPIAVAVALLLAMVFPSAVAAKPGVIHVPEDYDTIQDAVTAAEDGDKIIVGAGEWYGAEVDKAVEIKGEDGAVIVDGPVLTGNLKQGFWITSDGATISHFTFEVEFPVFAASVDDVTVEHNVMIDPIQGVTNWYGSSWVIRHNVVIGLWDFSGGGLGIFIGAKVDYPARDNLVAFNKITGDFPEEREYSCTGICLMTYGGEITGNKVVHNDVLITGWEAYAIGMTFSRYTPQDIEPQDVLYANKIGFNDLRGSTLEIACTLANAARTGYLSDEDARALMEGCNLISRNLGENRGHGVVPASEFRPVPEE